MSLCKEPEFPPGITDSEKTLLTCKSSVKCLSDVVNNNKLISENNNKILKNFELDLANFKILKSNYLNSLSNWEKRTGDFEKYSKRDGVSRDFWAKDYDGTCWWGENWGEANKWCTYAADKQGYNGDSYSAREWGGCYARHGNFRCGKPDDVVKQEKDDYNRDKPIFTVQEPKQSDYPLETPIPVNNIAINCCSNYMNITGVAENNIQTCTQVIEQKLNDLPKPVTAPVTTSVNTEPIIIPRSETVTPVIFTALPATKDSEDIYPRNSILSSPDDYPKDTVSDKKTQILQGGVVILFLTVIFFSCIISIIALS